MTLQNEPGAAVKPARLRKSTLDKDLGKIDRMEAATRSATRNLLAPGIAVLFLTLVGSLAAFHIGVGGNGILIVAASVIGGYMALTIGANDVANNVSPAVGARALTMTGALIIAAFCESAGALLAGGDVVDTISKGLVSPADFPDRQTFIWLMMSALLSSAFCLHLATFLGAPISTTHAIVGAVLGAALVAVGPQTIQWTLLGTIALGWVTSPLLAGFVAALFLAFIKVMILYRDDKIAAARLWVPVLIAVMSASFTGYLLIKGLGSLWAGEPLTAFAISVGVGVLTYVAANPLIRRQSEGLENRKQSIKPLFHLPLIFSAGLLSFAHGANDVANAVGPVAAILHSIDSEATGGSASLPIWVMMIGAFGISLGLLLFGPRLVRLVGNQITKMNPMRAYCVALSAALTVIVASALGLPVSSTHIAVGAIFGVGFFREYWTIHYRRRRHFGAGYRPHKAPRYLTAIDRDVLRRRKLVRRSHFATIVAAWIITVPAAAFLAALMFTAINFAR
jgi:PiT family inorganic phosphate transporter